MDRRRRSVVSAPWFALVCAAMACSLGLPRPTEVSPPPATSALATEEIPLPTGASSEPIIVAHLEPDFYFYDTAGQLLETRSAEGLSWARPNTAQVIGDAVYYVAGGDGDQGEVVRRVTSTETTDLDFTRAESFNGMAFAVSSDGERIAWSNTVWDGPAPVSQLWMAEIDGESPTLVAQTDPVDDVPEWFVLEPVTWLGDGDLVYAWQVTGIGGYILFFGWSSLYRYNPTSAAVTLLAPVGPEVGPPCWNDLTSDGAFAVGACGAAGQVVERATNSGLETAFPLLPDQGQSGAGAYTPSGDRLAYAIALGDPDNEAGQLVVIPSRGEGPAVVASHAPGAFDAILWLDEDRMAAGYWQGDATFVDLVTSDGARSLIGEGRLVGLMRP